MLTDVYGASGSGKSQLCFSLCANCVRNGNTAIFVDTAGTFRPERIAEISGSIGSLEKIKFVRALNTIDQVNAVGKMLDAGSRLVIFDTLTSLYSAEYNGPARHLAVMKHLHELAIAAINTGCALVVTNMVRNIPMTVVDKAARNISQTVVPSQQREYLGSSVSIYSHIKIKLEIIDAAKSLFQATLVQPPRKDPVLFAITSRGLSDPN